MHACSSIGGAAYEKRFQAEEKRDIPVLPAMSLSSARARRREGESSPSPAGCVNDRVKVDDGEFVLFSKRKKDIQHGTGCVYAVIILAL
jgi:hypothetical protein